MTSTVELRRLVATEVLNDCGAQIQISNLVQLLSTDSSLIKDYPFMCENDRDQAGYSAMAAAIASDGVWASEVEHGIVAKLLRELDITLITLDCTSLVALTEDCDVEEQLLKALEAHRQRTKHCVVLVHIANNHYMYMALNRMRLIEMDLLHSYVSQFLETDSD